MLKKSAKSNHWCCNLISLPIGATAVQLVKFYLFTVAGNNLGIPVVPVIPFVPASGRSSFRSFQLPVIPAPVVSASGRSSFRSCSVFSAFRSFLLSGRVQSFQVNSISYILMVQQLAASSHSHPPYSLPLNAFNMYLGNGGPSHFLLKVEESILPEDSWCC
jgi:hypothetical protein